MPDNLKRLQYHRVLWTLGNDERNSAVLKPKAGAGVAVWFAAEVFKMGSLMQGKPPSPATLVRWARMA